MSRSAVELDFFRMEKESSAKSQAKELFDRRRTFRGIQSVISKMNPELLKFVIGSGSVEHNSDVAKSSENGDLLASKPPFSIPSTRKQAKNLFHALPIFYTPPAFKSDRQSCPIVPLFPSYSRPLGGYRRLKQGARYIITFGTRT
ncbi:hypothetical protein U1Q18_005068 [Sarracenia purpurea var. burkii]